MEYLNLKVKEVKKETNDAVSVHFEKPDDSTVNYKSGQFLTFLFDLNGQEERRAYSLCSSPYVDNELAVAVKRVQNGLVSNHINDNVKAGDVLNVIKPMGTFLIEPSRSKQRHIVLLGGGSGITPLLSIMKTILSEEPSSKVSLVYANKNKESVIFASEIETLESKHEGRLKVAHYLDEENATKKKLFKKNKPYLTKDKLKEILSGLNIHAGNESEFFICGPSGMMEVAEKTLHSLKISSEKIKKESFVSFGAADDKEESTKDDKVTKVKVKYMGQEYNIDVNSGTPILTAALDSGIDLPFSCQSGLCTACMGKLVQGKLEMKNNMALTDTEVNDGMVLTCVGHPTTEDVIIEIE